MQPQSVRDKVRPQNEESGELNDVQKFKSFVKEAKTVIDVPFEFTRFQTGMDNNAVSIVGKVFVNNEWKKMIWDIKGNALLLGLQYSLVHEINFELEEPFE